MERRIRSCPPGVNWTLVFDEEMSKDYLGSRDPQVETGWAAIVTRMSAAAPDFWTAG
jgi:hypothetical protein